MSAPATNLEEVPGLPVDLQPSVLAITPSVTSVESAWERVDERSTIGFALSPGQRFAAVASAGGVSFTFLDPADLRRFGDILSETLKSTAMIQGPFVAEFVASHVDVLGDRVPKAPGNSDSRKTVISIYPVLFAESRDFRLEPLADRLKVTEALAIFIDAGLAQFSEDGLVTCAYEPALTKKEKGTLVARTNRRDGEVWFDHRGRRTTSNK